MYLLVLPLLYDFVHWLDCLLCLLRRLDQAAINHVDLLHHVVFELIVELIETARALQNLAGGLGRDMAMEWRFANSSNGLVYGLELGDDVELMGEKMRPCFSPVASGVNELCDGQL